MLRSLWLLMVFACGTPAPVAKTPEVAALPDAAPVDEDCEALRRWPAVGVAVVTSGMPDCSGVGHLRVALEVRHLARGEGVSVVTASRPLHGGASPGYRRGDVLVVGIEPQKRPAEKVFCVPMPARQGVVRDAIEVGSVDEGKAMLARCER